MNAKIANRERMNAQEQRDIAQQRTNEAMAAVKAERDAKNPEYQAKQFAEQKRHDAEIAASESKRQAKIARLNELKAVQQEVTCPGKSGPG